MSVGRFLVTVTAASLAIGCFADSVRAQQSDDENAKKAVTIYSEIDVTKSAYDIDTEAYVALNGNSSLPGLLMYASIDAGHYDYRNTDVPGGRVSAIPISGNLMLGYQGYTRENANWNVLIGVDVEDNELHPNDPSNPVRGSQVGFSVKAEIESDDERPFYYDLDGEYTTAYQTFYSRWRIGYGSSTLKIGPEVTLVGDETYDAQRIGGFLRFPLQSFRKLEPYVTIASGYENLSWSDKTSGATGGFGGIAGDGPGPYGTASLEFDF
jgi:Cellulose biosynthesis protein BcsS